MLLGGTLNPKKYDQHAHRLGKKKKRGVEGVGVETNAIDDKVKQANSTHRRCESAGQLRLLREQIFGV